MILQIKPKRANRILFIRDMRVPSSWMIERDFQVIEIKLPADQVDFLGS
jgi:hypothetical protein